MLSQFTRRAAQSIGRSVAPSARTAGAVRSISYIPEGSREQMTGSLADLHNQVLGANWGDYLELVHNVPFWEFEMERLNAQMQGHESDKELGPKWKYMQEAWDCMYACEDVRDHINEILELMTRKTGVMGMGINAGPQIENMDEQAEMLDKAYQELLKTYPTFKPKIEQSVGHGLAILRMKHKFAFSSGHRFFF